MIKGQCTLALETKMKCNSDYTGCIAPNDPLRLKAHIKRTIISQWANKYTFAVLYELEVRLFDFQHNKLSVHQWLERLNTKVDIGDTLGVNRDHPMALEHIAKELYNMSYKDLSNPVHIKKVQLDAREQYLAYIFLRQSSSDHDTMKHELENSFTIATNANTGEMVYLRTRDDIFGQLQRYHRTKKRHTSSEGSSSAQTGHGGAGRGTGGCGGKLDTEYWADKKRHFCKKLGHPINCQMP
jgi:hypothetical protein